MAKKPSNQIIDIIDSLEGNTITDEQKAEIKRLCKMTDKRDQQLRKARKPAAKKARR